VAQKKSSLTGINLELIKEEVSKNIEHIESANILDINDDIDFVPTQTGGTVPRVTTSIEQKMSSYVVLVKGSIDQFKYIVEVEQQVTSQSEILITRFKKILQNIRDYYKTNSQETISNREHLIERTSGKGKTYALKVLAANIPTQIVSRITARGGGEIPISLKHLFN
jgi:hypothetical protein